MRRSIHALTIRYCDVSQKRKMYAQRAVARMLPIVCITTREYIVGRHYFKKDKTKTAEVHIEVLMGMLPDIISLRDIKAIIPLQTLAATHVLARVGTT